MNTQKDVSVVIGFRDWGINRICMAVQSILESARDLSIEVIVSDYGSKDVEGSQEVIEARGAKYIYSETIDDAWSRSRALNAGFALSTGKVLVSTDADMLFSPGSFDEIGSMVLANKNVAVALQCRDLPEGYSDSDINLECIDWNELSDVARLRPRWGVGGMMACTREAYMEVRGLDERMHTYGGEDLDFAQRLQRAGNRLVWIDKPNVKMYHMWHAPTISDVNKTVEGQLAVEANKRIVKSDLTFVRNVLSWQYRPNDAPTLVSVVISTKNRSNLLRDSINSVLAQTVDDFELIIVDDGSTDDTRSVVESFDDERIRYIYQESSGIAAARNLASASASGAWTVVHDDDDIMVPNRLERHFESLTPGSSGSYGAYVNFSDVTGDTALLSTKKFNINTAMPAGGAPGHPTWMVRTEVLRKLGYDETCRSGSDNNLALRILRAGFRMDHTGKIMTLRRMHTKQVTTQDSGNQKSTAKLSHRFLQFITSEHALAAIVKNRGDKDLQAIEGKNGYDEEIRSYLPDHLIVRSVNVSELGNSSDYIYSILNEKSVMIILRDAEGNVMNTRVQLADAKLEQLVKLQKLGAKFETTAQLVETDEANLEFTERSFDKFELLSGMLPINDSPGASQVITAVENTANESQPPLSVLYDWKLQISGREIFMKSWDSLTEATEYVSVIERRIPSVSASIISTKRYLDTDDEQLLLNVIEQRTKTETER